MKKLLWVAHCLSSLVKLNLMQSITFSEKHPLSPQRFNILCETMQLTVVCKTTANRQTVVSCQRAHIHILYESRAKWGFYFWCQCELGLTTEVSFLCFTETNGIELTFCISFTLSSVFGCVTVVWRIWPDLCGFFPTWLYFYVSGISLTGLPRLKQHFENTKVQLWKLP